MWLPIYRTIPHVYIISQYCVIMCILRTGISPCVYLYDHTCVQEYFEAFARQLREQHKKKVANFREVLALTREEQKQKEKEWKQTVEVSILVVKSTSANIVRAHWCSYPFTWYYRTVVLRNTPL